LSTSFSGGSLGRLVEPSQGAVAVGDMDGFVVEQTVGQAVPEDLEPAVAEGAQRLVVAITDSDLGVNSSRQSVT
jgi:hypothetical protein